MIFPVGNACGDNGSEAPGSGFKGLLSLAILGVCLVWDVLDSLELALKTDLQTP